MVYFEFCDYQNCRRYFNDEFRDNGFSGQNGFSRLFPGTDFFYIINNGFSGLYSILKMMDLADSFERKYHNMFTFCKDINEKNSSQRYSFSQISWVLFISYIHGWLRTYYIKLNLSWSLNEQTNSATYWTKSTFYG